MLNAGADRTFKLACRATIVNEKKRARQKKSLNFFPFHAIMRACPSFLPLPMLLAQPLHSSSPLRKPQTSSTSHPGRFAPWSNAETCTPSAPSSAAKNSFSTPMKSSPMPASRGRYQPRGRSAIGRSFVGNASNKKPRIPARLRLPGNSADEELF